MNIIEQCADHNARHIVDVGRGFACRFVSKFHQEHDVTSIFMRCTAPNGYRPDFDRYGEKIPVVNLRTGKISYVAPHRDVYVYKSHVQIEGRCR